MVYVEKPQRSLHQIERVENVLACISPVWLPALPIHLTAIITARAGTFFMCPIRSCKKIRSRPPAFFARPCFRNPLSV